MDGIIIDIVIIAVFLLTVGIYTYRGFAKSVMDFAVLIAAFIVAKIFGGYLADWLNETFVYNAVNGTVHTILVDALGGAIDNIDANAILRSIPESLISVLEFAGTDFDSVSNYILSLDFSASESLMSVAVNISTPISELVSKILAYLILFVGGLIVFKLISVIILAIFKLPVLKTLDKVLGFVMGLVAGLIFSWVFAVVLRLCLSLLAMKYPELDGLANAESFIYSFFTGIGI